jgi:hypothetical protein
LSRFFLRATRQTRLGSQADERREWLIEPLEPEESLTCFLRSYSRDTEILAETPPMNFVADLHQRWMAEYGAGQDQSVTSRGWPQQSRTIFFISYSRKTDLPKAESLYQALLKLGVIGSEVWFDRREIEPGQDFQHRIIDGIRGCRYFLALLSDAGSSREEAFVFDEWQEANARNKAMNRDFIFPVVVDADYDPKRYVAKPLRDGDWDRLDFCHAPNGVPDERMMTKLTRLLREARRI